MVILVLFKWYLKGGGGGASERTQTAMVWPHSGLHIQRCWKTFLKRMVKIKLRVGSKKPMPEFHIHKLEIWFPLFFLERFYYYQT